MKYSEPATQALACLNRTQSAVPSGMCVHMYLTLTLTHTLTLTLTPTLTHTHTPTPTLTLTLAHITLLTQACLLLGSLSWEQIAKPLKKSQICYLYASQGTGHYLGTPSPLKHKYVCTFIHLKNYFLMFRYLYSNWWTSPQFSSSLLLLLYSFIHRFTYSFIWNEGKSKICERLHIWWWPYMGYSKTFSRMVNKLKYFCFYVMLSWY